MKEIAGIMTFSESLREIESSINPIKMDVDEVKKTKSPLNPNLFDRRAKKVEMRAEGRAPILGTSLLAFLWTSTDTKPFSKQISIQLLVR